MKNYIEKNRRKIFLIIQILSTPILFFLLILAWSGFAMGGGTEAGLLLILCIFSFIFLFNIHKKSLASNLVLVFIFVIFLMFFKESVGELNSAGQSITFNSLQSFNDFFVPTLFLLIVSIISSVVWLI